VTESITRGLPCETAPGDVAPVPPDRPLILTVKYGRKSYNASQSFVLSHPYAWWTRAWASASYGFRPSTRFTPAAQ
jgi:hypothetical protein